MPATADRRLAVLLAPGNGGNRAGRLGLARALAGHGLTVLLMDYRGYGGNPGSPSEEGLAADVRAAWAHLVRVQGFPAGRILYLGESLGGAVVTRLATEHPLLDDNGDRLGTPPDWFRGVRAVKAPSAGQQVDGRRAQQWRLVPAATEQGISPEQRQRRDELELAIFDLRDRQTELGDDEYFRQLEGLALAMAALDAEIEAAAGPPTPPAEAPPEKGAP